MKRGPIVAVAIIAAVVIAVAAGVPLQRLLPLLLLLACPLMMLFMHHGGHGRHAAQSESDGRTQIDAREEVPADKQ